MMLDLDDTIVAIASPPGAGDRGIIRVSGPQSLRHGETVFELADQTPLNQIKQRSSVDGHLLLNNSARLPGRLLIWPDHRSYTRQPTIEFHTIGSPPLLQMASAAICRAGARLAERGEFTLRAFLSGRIDLTQAEAVLAVIDANGQEQLSNALRQLSGGLSGPLADIRESLIGILAELEAGLDFVEEDIEFISSDELQRTLKEILSQLTDINKKIRARGLSRDQFSVALVGPPNAGKSSLFNALVESERAIVANVEGTTRDFVSASIQIGEMNVEMIDTAGIAKTQSDSSDEAPAAQAQSKTQTVIDQADLLVHCLDSSSTEETAAEYFRIHHTNTPSVATLTKSDLNSGNSPQIDGVSKAIRSTGYSSQVIVTSSANLAGVAQLQTEITACLQQTIETGASVVSTTATRASDSLEKTENCLETALSAAQDDIGLEIVASELRQALEKLGSVVGTVYTDDILDQIFGRFCIGK